MFYYTKFKNDTICFWDRKKLNAVFQNEISQFQLMKPSPYLLISKWIFFPEWRHFCRSLFWKTGIFKTEIIFKHLWSANIYRPGAIPWPMWLCRHNSTMWILIICFMFSIVSDKTKLKRLSQPWRACSVKVLSYGKRILTVQEKNVSWQLATYAQCKVLETEGYFSKNSVCNVFLQLITNGQLATCGLQFKLQPTIMPKGYPSAC